eukprot:m.34587 g.34587  ORF g.34587 m.34587 type:complete len:446 (-) comp5674_c0_seq2:138-1475(-)
MRRPTTTAGPKSTLVVVCAMLLLHLSPAAASCSEGGLQCEEEAQGSAAPLCPAHSAGISVTDSGSVQLCPRDGAAVRLGGSLGAVLDAQTARLAAAASELEQLQARVESLERAQCITGATFEHYFVANDSLAGEGTWSSGALGPDGKIYGVPRSAPAVLVIDPATDAIDVDSLQVSPGVGKWWGGALAPNGKIYCAPLAVTSVLVIDPVNSSTTELPVPFSSSYDGIELKYVGAILGSTGFVYCVPHLAKDILVIRPLDDGAIFEFIPVNVTVDRKWASGVAAPNGKLYFAPYHAPHVLMLDPATNETQLYDSGRVGEAKFVGAVVGPGGDLFFIPYQSDVVLRMSTAATPLFQTIPFDPVGVSLKWVGGILMPDNKIYCAPAQSGSILVIDPSSATTSLVPIKDAGTTDHKWMTSIRAPNGKVYSIPFDINGLLVFQLTCIIGL